MALDHHHKYTAYNNYSYKYLFCAKQENYEKFEWLESHRNLRAAVNRPSWHK